MAITHLFKEIEMIGVGNHLKFCHQFIMLICLGDGGVGERRINIQLLVFYVHCIEKFSEFPVVTFFLFNNKTHTQKNLMHLRKTNKIRGKKNLRTASFKILLYSQHFPLSIPENHSKDQE